VIQNYVQNCLGARWGSILGSGWSFVTEFLAVKCRGFTLPGDVLWTKRFWGYVRVPLAVRFEGPAGVL